MIQPRYRVLALYVVLQALMQLEWLRFAPVTGDAALLYGVSAGAIGDLSLVFPLLFIVLALPCGWLIDRLSVRGSMRWVAAVMAVAACGRAASVGYPAVLTAQLAFAVVQPLVMSLVGRMATVWFAPDRRLMVAEMGSVALFAGIGLAFVLVPLAGGDSLRGSLWIDAVVLVVVWLLVMFMVPADAATVAVESEGAAGTVAAPPPPLRLMALLRLPEVLTILLLIFLGNGYFNAVSTWLEPIVQRHGVNAQQAGIVALLMLIGGMVGMAVVERVRQRLGLRLIVMAAGLFGVAATVVLFSTGSVPLLCVDCFVLGLLLLSPLPLLIQWMLQVAGEAHAGIAISVFWLVANAGAVVAIYALSVVADAGYWRLGAGLLGAMLLLEVIVGAVCLRQSSPALARVGD